MGQLTISKAEPSAEAQRELAPIISIRQLLPQFVVDSHERFQEASNILAGLKAEAKRIKERRDHFVTPAKEWIGVVTELFAPVLEAYSTAEKDLKSKLAAFDAKIEAERVAAMIANKPVEVPPPAAAKGVTVRVVKKYRVVSETAVPKEFCTPDMAKINSWYATCGGSSILYPKGIPGVEEYEDRQVTSRGSK
jgi:hypothetical protein